jgi:hypothetical protein
VRGRDRQRVLGREPVSKLPGVVINPNSRLMVDGPPHPELLAMVESERSRDALLLRG